MAVSGILQSDVHEQATAASVREWILSGNEPVLRNQFAYLANQQVWIGALLVLAWVVSRSYRWRVLGTAPFALIFVTSIFYLALEYGTLALPIKFREASIPTESPTAKLYLLNQIDEGYVVWDCRQTRWIPQQTRVNFFEVRTLREIIASCQREDP
jgi:hypothetical protein